MYCRREKSNVPQLVKALVCEVESWRQGSFVGLNETGLYRVSGTLTEILELKRLIDKEATVNPEVLKNRDIHALTGTFRVHVQYCSVIYSITMHKVEVEVLHYVQIHTLQNDYCRLSIDLVETLNYVVLYV